MSDERDTEKIPAGAAEAAGDASAMMHRRPCLDADQRLPDVPAGEDCTCGYIMLGSERTKNRNWSDMCAVHGVGTDYFRALKRKPFGYANEADTTREEYLEWKNSSLWKKG